MITHEEKPKQEIFVVLGSSHSSRLEAVWQIIDFLHFNGEKTAVCVHESEIDFPESKTKERAIEKGMIVTTWSIDEKSATLTKTPDATEEERVTIFVGHGKHYLVDTIEALSKWLPDSPFELQRIITWVDGDKYANTENAKSWYECCFNFSDLVILDEFKDLPLSWLKEIKDHFKTESMPCIVENTKKGRLQNLHTIVDNLLLRVSQVFEQSNEIQVEYEIEGDEEDDELADEEDLNKPIMDPYFERVIDGKRAKPVPKF